MPSGLLIRIGQCLGIELVVGEGGGGSIDLSNVTLNERTACMMASVDLDISCGVNEGERDEGETSNEGKGIG